MRSFRNQPQRGVILCRRLSAEDLREGLGAVGQAMDSASVKKLASELDVDGCGSVNLEVRAAAGLCSYKGSV